jgi:hypothetical protein
LSIVSAFGLKDQSREYLKQLVAVIITHLEDVPR